MDLSSVIGSSLANFQLQSTIAAQTSGSSEVLPHHPISCQSDLAYYDDGTFSCEHATAPPDDIRSQQCVTHSIALLILELAMSR